MAIFIKYTCLESVQSFVLNAYAIKAYIIQIMNVFIRAMVRIFS